LAKPSEYKREAKTMKPVYYVRWFDYKQHIRFFSWATDMFALVLQLQTMNKKSFEFGVIK
jgi:hypothetical protein